MADHDDQTIPNSVKMRLLRQADGRCQKCGVHLGIGWDVDHIIALCLGGPHRESNLQCLCKNHHKKKTKQDISLKCESDRKRIKLTGPKRKSKWPNARDGKYKTKIGGRTELRDD